MGEGKEIGFIQLLLVWVLALALALAVFYGLDHSIMSMQGLPLNWDLTPAQ